MAKSIIQEICPKIKCTGCQACRLGCLKNAISMEEDEHGHIYPTINQQLCVNCGKCRRICPSIHEIQRNEIKDVYAGWIKEKNARKQSTSGGVAHLLSEYVIKNGGYVCGAIWQTPGVIHKIVSTIEELAVFQGSKYAHSDVKETYKEVEILLIDSQLVLFTGTPCQIAGLKAFLGKYYANLLTLDIICHGVPSRKILRDRIGFMQKQKGKQIINVRFRDKQPDQLHTCMKYIYNDGTSDSVSVYVDPYFCCFVDNYSLRENCYHCQYAGSNRVGDFSLADYWGYTPYSFKYKDYGAGVSAIIVNTDKAQRIIDLLKPNLLLDKRDYTDASKANRNMKLPQSKPHDGNLFWFDYIAGETVENLASKYYRPKKNIDSGLKEQIRILTLMILPRHLIQLVKKIKTVMR